MFFNKMYLGGIFESEFRHNFENVVTRTVYRFGA